MTDFHPYTDFFITETKEILIRQLNDVNAIDSKASILLGTDAIAVTAALTILISTPPIQNQYPSNTLFLILVSATLAAFIASVLFAMLAYRITTYTETINPRAVYEKWADLDEETMKMQYLHNLIGAYEKNSDVIDSKANRVTFSLISLGVATLCGMAAIAVYFVSL